jgi:triosephosphate isomerase
MTSGRTPLIAGNWKMNLDHLQATHLVQKLDWTLKDGKHDFGAVEVAVLPPFTDLRSVQTLIDGDRLELKYGAQDLSVHDAGAYTGEISGAFLAKLGCTYVAVGHSERREYHHETDAVVARRSRPPTARHHADLLLRRGPGDPQAGTHVEHVLAQVEAGLDGLSVEQARSIVVAYEPIWAIGTGEVATPEDAQEVCAAIRTKLAELYSGDVADGIRILYGGSVKSATSPRSWPRRTSTARSSAGPRSTRPSSPRSAASGTTSPRPDVPLTGVAASSGYP